MPTGYTHAVQTGEITDLESFVIRCARAMGTLIMMRDEPMDAPVPERFEPSDYHTNAINAAQAKLDRLAQLTPAEIAKGAERAYQKELNRYKAREEERTVEQSRYEAMLEKVEAWEPPTHEHQGLKEFMLDQLRESIRFDYSPMPAPEKQPPDEWYAAELASARRDLKYHTKEHREEIERTEARNKWIQDLRDSLNSLHPELSI